MHEIIVSKEMIQNKIYTVRAMQVMLDSDLADLYQVETKQLNRAVSRNLKRFPESFRFQVTKEEYDEILRYQFGTSSIRAILKDLGKKWFDFSKMDEESFGILERLK